MHWDWISFICGIVVNMIFVAWALDMRMRSEREKEEVRNENL